MHDDTASIPAATALLVKELRRALNVKNLPLTLGVDQVASSLGVHAQTVRLRAKAGTLPFSRISVTDGRNWRFRTADVLAYLLNDRALAPTPPAPATPPAPRKGPGPGRPFGSKNKTKAAAQAGKGALGI
ncbi:excisionase family DNA-binding protein [Desulfovibrio aerotolerans]|uniref:Excisionase family DNA-binding protein n=1 Tax=Solidesulfovibrio aerotolerans TaxID=295255 RepID=A0A7C9MGC9_9BACT|nr:helix-turn-helix domain-containing protein [Solidesulfovibrio aerotolerans]MYL81808.1 excisionase family DNA-binding protein [Solidesulfovibrio aerotolerans]